jgi:hypothetical protein
LWKRRSRWGQARALDLAGNAPALKAAPAHQLVALDQLQHFRIAGHRRCWQALQQLQELLAIAQIAAGQFADHPGMDQRLTLLQEPGETGQATAQMLHPG